MRKNLKNDLLKKIILLENIVLLLITLMSTVLFLCGADAGYGIFMISSYILYPVILLSFAIGFILKAVETKDYKLNFALFVSNLAVSFVCLLALLYKFADVLESF